MLKYHPMTEREKQIVCDWKYEGAYAIYNLPPYEEQLRARRGFANPVNSFYSFYDGEELIGYINLVDEEKEVFFGIGVAPEKCSQGYGQQMTKMACELSQRLYPGKPIYLEVRTWNHRAVSCYEKAGFRIASEAFSQETSAGEGRFYRMVAES